MEFSTYHHQIGKVVGRFLISLAIIVVLGIIMVYSSSYIYAKENYNNSTYFLVRQITFLLIGILVASIVWRTKFSFWLKFGYWVNILMTCVLSLTFVPSFRVAVKGAGRWIEMGLLQFQPGEVIKYTLLIASIYFFETCDKLSRGQKIFHSFWLLIPLALLIAQPDFGTFTICFLVIGFVCYMSSFSRRHLYIFFGVGTLAIIFLLFEKSYRVQRILTFLDPWKNPQTSGFQIIQSFLAFGGGSLSGQGLGNSKEKLFYLPEAHNDFIFSVIGEELGFWGVCLVITLFILLLYFGLKLALMVKNRSALLLISAVSFTIGLQALLNMGITLGLFPTKGLNLPFISYGGSALVASFFGVGLVLSATRHCRKDLAQRNHLYFNST